MVFLYSLLTVPYRVGCDGSPGQGNDCCTSQNQCGEIEGRVDMFRTIHDTLKAYMNGSMTCQYIYFFYTNYFQLLMGLRSFQKSEI